MNCINMFSFYFLLDLVKDNTTAQQQRVWLRHQTQLSLQEYIGKKDLKKLKTTKDNKDELNFKNVLQ